MGTPLVSSSTYPPYLNRWLNTNLVSPIKRARTWLTVPAFSIAHVWNGYSKIVGCFDFNAGHNFCLVGADLVFPASPNYVMCISYTTSGRSVVRYKLWEGVGEIIYDTAIPLYDGQLIQAQCRFEIWNTAVTPAVQADDITFYTGVASLVDTVWNTDSALASASALITTLQQDAVAGDFAVPLTFPNSPTLNS